MNQDSQLLKDYSELEKGAYLGAIATIATADREASAEEINFLQVLSEASNLSEQQQQAVLSSAKDPSNISLQKCLDQLKNSELKYALITDVISFAKADNKYTPDEEAKIKEMAAYLDVNQEQFGALNQFVAEAGKAQAQGQDITQNNFLGSSGIGDTLKRSGIPSGGLMKGLLGVLAPILIAKVMGGKGGIGSAMPGMGSGNMGGGLGGILGNILGGGQTPHGMPAQQPQTQPNGGGLGSLINILGGNKGHKGMGGLLGNILSGKSGF